MCVRGEIDQLEERIQTLETQETVGMYEYHCTVERVVDGDTLDLNIDLGMHIHLHERVRLFGVDGSSNA